MPVINASRKQNVYADRLQGNQSTTMIALDFLRLLQIRGRSCMTEPKNSTQNN